jgi:hypothetical protein
MPILDRLVEVAYSGCKKTSNMITNADDRKSPEHTYKIWFLTFPLLLKNLKIRLATPDKRYITIYNEYK